MFRVEPATTPSNCRRPRCRHCRRRRRHHWRLSTITITTASAVTAANDALGPARDFHDTVRRTHPPRHGWRRLGRWAVGGEGGILRCGGGHSRAQVACRDPWALVLRTPIARSSQWGSGGLQGSMGPSFAYPNHKIAAKAPPPPLSSLEALGPAAV